MASSLSRLLCRHPSGPAINPTLMWPGLFRGLEHPFFHLTRPSPYRGSFPQQMIGNRAPIGSVGWPTCHLIRSQTNLTMSSEYSLFPDANPSSECPLSLLPTSIYYHTSLFRQAPPSSFSRIKKVVGSEGFEPPTKRL